MFRLVLLALVIAVASAAYNSTTGNLGSKGPYCYPESGFADCLDECRTPDSGATCDAEYAGVNAYWCCHNPLPGKIQTCSVVHTHTRTS